MTATPTAPAGQRRARGKHTRTAYFFLGPYLVLFALFMLVPAVAGIVISFTDWGIIGTPEFTGLENYVAIFGDGLFRRSLINTLYFVVLAAPATVVLGLALALLLNQRLRGRTVARAVVFSPHVVMVSAVGIIWVWIYDSAYGVLNYYLRLLGIPQLGWLTSTELAMPALAITTIWWTVNTIMIIYLAALQDIPTELYEAATMDGAGVLARFWHITLPQLRSVSIFVVPYTVIISWRVFGQAYVMTKGGPETSTFVVGQYIFQTAFQDFQMGPASAAAVVLLIITMIFTLIQLKAMRAI